MRESEDIMRKQRINIKFKGYMGKVKKGKLWQTLGTFKTIDDAVEAGATKCVPQYSRG